MTTTPDTSGNQRPPVTADEGTADEGTATLAELTQRLGRLAGRPVGREEALRQLADLEVASEELRVVEEEVRVQQAQLAQLVRRYETEHHWRSQLSALVPIGLCLTDGVGKVVDANPALAAQLQVGLHRLRGKPLSVFLDPQDVPAFRSALRTLTGQQTRSYRAAITVRGRQSESRAELFGFVETPGRPETTARVQWVLMPELRTLEPEVLTAGADGAPRPASSSDHDASMRAATALARLSALPADETDQQRMLTRIAQLVQDAVPAARWTSVTLGSPVDPQRLGSNGPEAQEFDGLQLQAQEGPCQDAYAAGTTVLSGDVVADARWPALARIAGHSPVHAVLAVPVRESPDLGGALNLYSPEPDAFDGASVRIADLVGTAVSGALQSAAERRGLQQLAGHLETALTSRAVIDQAKGVLMAHLGLTADEAFARLVALSNRLNVKVRDLATLVTEGHLDALIDVAG